MLRVTRLTDRTGRYYLADLARELGPAVESPAGRDRLGGADLPGAGAAGPIGLAPGRPGWWTGAGAEGLGLAGPVGDGELAAVLDGRHPATGRPLVRRPGTVAGYDLTFTAPKSASVLFALGTPDVSGQVLAAHQESVAAALGYVATRAAAVRRGAEDERWSAPVDGLVAAGFVHGVSRALDPHLHTHVVVANMGHGPDGRWTALDGRGLFAHGPAGGQLHEAHLRHLLSSRLGVEWTLRRSGTYEIDGIGPAVLGALSSRRAEIRQHLAERAPGGAGAAARPSRRAEHVAWAATREAKDPHLEPEALARRWWRHATDAGLAAPDLAQVVGRARPGRALRDGALPVGALSGDGRSGHAAPGHVTQDQAAPGHVLVDEHRFAARLAATPHGAVARRDVMAAWAAALGPGAPVPEVERCADRLAAWGPAVGVDERRRAPSRVVPAPYQVRALGPRPAESRLLGVWLDAAADLARYRGRWGVDDRIRPLGVDGSARDLSAMATPRLADHLAVTRRLAEAHRALGRTLARDAEPPHLARDR